MSANTWILGFLTMKCVTGLQSVALGGGMTGELHLPCAVWKSFL